MSNDPITDVEGRQGMLDMAVMTKAYYDGLRSQGFDHKSALDLTGRWVTGIVSASRNDS